MQHAPVDELRLGIIEFPLVENRFVEQSDNIDRCGPLRYGKQPLALMPGGQQEMIDILATQPIRLSDDRRFDSNQHPVIPAAITQSPPAPASPRLAGTLIQT